MLSKISNKVVSMSPQDSIHIMHLCTMFLVTLYIDIGKGPFKSWFISTQVSGLACKPYYFIQFEQIEIQFYLPKLVSQMQKINRQVTLGFDYQKFDFALFLRFICLVASTFFFYTSWKVHSE